jgi:hypothetical protein
VLEQLVKPEAQPQAVAALPDVPGLTMVTDFVAELLVQPAAEVVTA